MRARRAARGAARRESDEPRPRSAPPCAVTPRSHQLPSPASEIQAPLPPAPRPPAATPPPQSSSRRVGTLSQIPTSRQLFISRRAVAAAPRMRAPHARHAPRGPLAWLRSEGRSGTWSGSRRGNWSGTDRDTRAPAEAAEGAGTRARAAEAAEARAIRAPVAQADLAGGGEGARAAATEEEEAHLAARGGEAATPPRVATLRPHGRARRHGSRGVGRPLAPSVTPLVSRRAR